MNELYRCLYCDITVDGPDAWLEHINTSTHRQKLLGPALQEDPGDYGADYVWSSPIRSSHDGD